LLGQIAQALQCLFRVLLLLLKPQQFLKFNPPVPAHFAAMQSALLDLLDDVGAR
jgi:hypothetical protein